jgi:Plastocyanin
MMHDTGNPLLRFGLLLCVLCAFSPSQLLVAAESGQPGTAATVVIKQLHFQPDQMDVKVGDRVTWENQDIFTHTVTADDGSFDSGPIEPGKSWTLTATHQGRIAYHCRPHPNMNAQLIADGGGDSTKGASAKATGGTLKWQPPTRPEQIHPILVNFTAALLPLSFLSDLLGRIFKRQTLHHVAFWMIVYAACITPFTAAAGWWWKHAAGAALPAKLITVHQWLGTAAALIFIVLTVWRWRIHKQGLTPTVAYLVCALLAVLALVYQGSLGGAMAFGG